MCYYVKDSDDTVRFCMYIPPRHNILVRILIISFVPLYLQIREDDVTQADVSRKDLFGRKPECHVGRLSRRLLARKTVPVLIALHSVTRKLYHYRIR